MAHFFQQNVLIACTCGSLRPLTKIYFCRHCIVFRCSYCVAHEVDSTYCSNCLENLASSEAKLKKNRCGTCFDCPCCSHALTIRASTVSRINTPADGSPASTSKTSVKSYYLSCFFCRWTSREAKIPDQSKPTSSNWPEHENPHTARISSLIEHFKMIALRERLGRENRMFSLSTRRALMHISEKFGLSSMLARKRAGLPPLSLGRDDSATPPQVTPAEASEDVESLPDDVFSQPVDTLKITSLPQRFVIPDLQPESMADLFPTHKQLFIKRSQRCKTCLHNIFKPEFGPGSIKFKIHSAAYYYVPEIKLTQKIQAKRNEVNELLVKICNPALTSTQVQFLQIGQVSNSATEISNTVNEEKKDECSDETNVASINSVQKKPFPEEKRREIKFESNAKIILPEGVIGLAARDDTAEYDDATDTHQYQDDPAVVIWRKGNKIIVKFSVVPNDDVVEGDEIKVNFVMRFLYHDKAISPLEQKNEKDVDIDVRHYLNVGTAS